MDDDGLIVVDEYQRTSAEGVFLRCDVCSQEQLKHVANKDARVVQHNLLHPESMITSDRRFVPRAVFSMPQVASVGLTEAQAKEQGLTMSYRVRITGKLHSAGRWRTRTISSRSSPMRSRRSSSGPM